MPALNSVLRLEQSSKPLLRRHTGSPQRLSYMASARAGRFLFF